MNEKPDIVASVVKQAFYEVCPSTNLSFFYIWWLTFVQGLHSRTGWYRNQRRQRRTTCQTCLIVCGSQLSVLRPNSYKSAFVKIARYERLKNKKGLKKAIAFFRVLIPSLNSSPSHQWWWFEDVIFFSFKFHFSWAICSLLPEKRTFIRLWNWPKWKSYLNSSFGNHKERMRRDWIQLWPVRPFDPRHIGKMHQLHRELLE
jgi:hypothetical protein